MSSKTTATKQAAPQQAQAPVDDDARLQNQQVAVLQPARLPYHPVYQDRYGISGIMWRALVEGVYPSAKTPEGIILAVSYCAARNYDVMKKMVHVVPIWNTALGKEVEGVWEGIGALRATAFRTGQYAGCDETVFGPLKKQIFTGEVGRGQYAKTVTAEVEFPQWAQITVYRLVQGQRCAFPGPKVYWLAAYGCQGKSDVPNDKWQEGGGSYMLEKCTEAAALRKAFPEELGGVNSAEEMEGRKVHMPTGPTIDNEPAEPTPARPTRASVSEEQARAASDRQEKEAADAEARAAGRIPDDDPEHDEETGEIHDDGPANPIPAGEPVTPSKPAAQEPDNAAKPRARDLNPTKTELVNYTRLANDVIKKVMAAGTLDVIAAIEQTYDTDLNNMAGEAPNEYTRVETALNGKKDKLRQP